MVKWWSGAQCQTINTANAMFMFSCNRIAAAKCIITQKKITLSIIYMKYYIWHIEATWWCPQQYKLKYWIWRCREGCQKSWQIFCNDLLKVNSSIYMDPETDNLHRNVIADVIKFCPFSESTMIGHSMMPWKPLLAVTYILLIPRKFLKSSNFHSWIYASYSPLS